MKITILLLSLIFFSTPIIAQDYNIKKLQKIFDKEMSYQKDGNSIIFETLSPLNIKDYSKFQQVVRDSLAIETLYFNIEDDDKCLSYLKLIKKQSHHSSERELNRALFPLDRNIKDLYSSIEHIVNLQFMKLPREYTTVLSDEFSFDDRCVYYEKNEKKSFKYLDSILSNTSYPILHNHWELSQLSNTQYDIPNVLAQVLPVLFKENTPYNLTKNQYDAYLDWKYKDLITNLSQIIENHQIEIIPFFQTDTTKFVIHGLNLSKQWKINQSEYEDFIEYTHDSLVREVLFFELDEDDKAIKYINYSDFYLDEKNLEFVEFDASERIENRRLFNLNFKTRIKHKDLKTKKLLSILELKKSNDLTFCYRIIDFKNSLKNSIPYRLNSYKTRPWFLIDTVQVAILPIKKDRIDSNFISRLNYDQAIAFYNWKYPIRKSTCNSNWNNYIFPTEDEFLKMQTQPDIVFVDKSFSYITTAMKYKVIIFD